ncbi:MAG: metal-dependent transcriptional regulator [Chitinophagaceae bacterium]|nr:MAG: metal-dependent transcriptional regulator [Chitinophagaceae bacterium]
MKYSVSEENYIKSIYHLQAVHQQVTATMLAESVQTKAASVTDMLKKLQLKKLVHYKPYKSFTLTESGNKTALGIIRKHRLWEFFLVDKLQFEWNEVHDIAEELEHISSKELINRLDAFLGNPAFDPHGDPIPNSKGKMAEVKQKNLIELPCRKIHVVSLIKDQSAAMLDLLKHYNISIGTKLKINRRFEFDGSVEIKIDKIPDAILSKQVAQNIYCTV